MKMHNSSKFKMARFSSVWSSFDNLTSIDEIIDQSLGLDILFTPSKMVASSLQKAKRMNFYPMWTSYFE